MNTVRNIRAVSFDVWMTLIRSNPAFKPRRVSLIAEVLGVSDIDLLSTIIRNVDVRCDDLSDRTGVQFGPRDRLILIATEVGSNINEYEIKCIKQDIDELFLDYLPVIRENSTLNTLSKLRDNGIKIALASNTGFIDGDVMRKSLSEIGIMEFMDAAVFSNEVNVSKPAWKIYSEVSRELEVPLEEILHVGDNEKADFRGALNAGMHALWLTNTRGAYSIESIEEVLNHV
jgi:putative hydrolase of the HAD superfamily